MEFKSIELETRMTLDNMQSFILYPDGAVKIEDSPLINWEHCAAAMFGKMVKDLNKEQKDELNKLSSEEVTSLGEKARLHYSNPGQG